MEQGMIRGGDFILPDKTLEGLDKNFTAYDFTEEQLMFQKTLRDFMAKKVIPESDEIESKNWDVMNRILKELGELGALGVETPEQYGGSGLDKVTAAIFAEEIGWQGSLACTILADTGIGLLPLLLFGSEEQKEKFIPAVVAGQSVGAYSLSESNAGSDAQSIKAGASLSEDGLSYILNADKMWVTNGGIASYYIVFAKIKDTSKITAFIVERGFPGVEVGKEEHKLGIRGSSTTPIRFNNVSIPRENVLNTVEEDGFKIAMNILNIGRFKLGAACLGGTKQCFGEALDYSRERKQFLLAIRKFGAIRQKLARMAALIYALEAVVYRTAGLLDQSISSVASNNPKDLNRAVREFAAECSIVKVFASEVNYEVAGENIQIHGGNGFTEDYPAERHLRDSVINKIFEGTNEINRLLLVGETLKNKFMELSAEGNKIQNEILAGPSLSGSSLDIEETLSSRLKGAKKAVILAGGNTLKKVGMDKLTDPGNQEVLTLLADCFIYIYVLESALAVFVKHKKEKDEYLVRYLFDSYLPEIEKRSRSLVAIGAEGDDQRMISAAVKRFLKYEPENILILDRKIEEGFV